MVWIRLIGDKASVSDLSRRLLPHLKWRQYPLYIDKERTQIDKNRVALCAIAVDKDSTQLRTVRLDGYIFNRESSVVPEAENE